MRVNILAPTGSQGHTGQCAWGKKTTQALIVEDVSMSEDKPSLLSYRWNPRIACRTLEDTAFILHTSKMVSLNEVGTFIWESFKEGAEIKSVVDAVEENFEAPRSQIETDVTSFVEALVERTLLVQHSTEAPG